MEVNSFKKLINSIHQLSVKTVLIESNGKSISVVYNHNTLCFRTVLLTNKKTPKWALSVSIEDIKTAIRSASINEEVNFLKKEGNLIIQLISEKETESREIIPVETEETFLWKSPIKSEDPFWLSEAQWKDIVKIQNFILSSPSPEENFLNFFASGAKVDVTGKNKSATCAKSLKLKNPLLEWKKLALTTEQIIAISNYSFDELGFDMSPSGDKLLLIFNSNNILTETVITVSQGTDLTLDGMSPTEEAIKATVDKTNWNQLLKALETIKESGAKKITIEFNNSDILVQGNNQQFTIPATIVNPVKTVISVSLKVLYSALIAIKTGKIMFILPWVGANTLIIDAIAGTRFIIAATAKKVKEVSQKITDILEQPESEPEKVVLETGTNSDGSHYVVEAVEEKPSPQINTSKSDVFSVYVGILENVIAAVDIQLQKFDTSMQTEEEILLTRLKEYLLQIVSEANFWKQQLSSDALSPEKMPLCEDFILKLTWQGGRAMGFHLQLEKDWNVEIRVIKNNQ